MCTFKVLHTFFRPHLHCVDCFFFSFDLTNFLWRCRSDNTASKMVWNVRMCIQCHICGAHSTIVCDSKWTVCRTFLARMKAIYSFRNLVISFFFALCVYMLYGHEHRMDTIKAEHTPSGNRNKMALSKLSRFHLSNLPRLSISPSKKCWMQTEEQESPNRKTLSIN